MSENQEDKKATKIEITVPNKKEIESVRYRTPEQAYKIFRDIINYEEYELKGQEHFWVMGIDSTGYISCIYIAAIGSENRVFVEPIDVFGLAISKGVRSVILAHNHPNTKIKLIPSEADLDVTNQFYHACLTFSLTIIDHIIIADGYYYSFLESGDMWLIHQSLKYKAYNHIKHILDEKNEKLKEHHEFIGQYNKSIEIAKKMLAEGENFEKIELYTGLNIWQIENMIKDI